MGLCKITRGWRWHGSAGVGVLLLGISLAQTVHSQTACPAPVAPQKPTQPKYHGTPTGDTSVGFMATLVQSFLHTVQPNPFPKDLTLRIVQDFNQVLLSQDLNKEVLVYQMGFLVCAAIGVLYIVLMPIVGLFLACCRCCGKCGGKMYQNQTSSIQCHRRTLYWSASVTTVIILAGNVCMFKSNETLDVSVNQSPEELNKIIGNIHTFLTDVPQQVNYVVNEGYNTVEEVTRNLDAIGPLLGTAIQKQLRGVLDPALNSISLLYQVIVNTNVTLKKLDDSLAQLQSSMNLLQVNVTDVRNRISQTLSSPNCIDCNKLQPELQKLTLNTSITTPNLNDFQSAMDNVIKSNLKSKIKEVEVFFDSIPQTVTNDIKNVVQSSKQQLGDIKTQMSQVISHIPLSGLTNVLGTLDQVQRQIGMVTPEVERAESLRWRVCVTLCCVVLLVVVCNLLGLVLGPLGLSPNADPTKRSRTANCGGIFLMMAAGFSFLFCWLLMIVVLLLFLLGGNVYTLLCQPWKDGQLLTLIDTPGLIPGLEIGPNLGLKSNIKIADIYRDCEANQPLWTTLRLYELVNLDELLSVSKYTAQLQQQFENTNIPLSTITLLSPDVKNQLGQISATTKDFDFTVVTQQMNNIYNINLNTTADRLDTLAALQTNTIIKNQLQIETRDLRQIQNNIETTIIPQLKNLNSTIKSLRSITEKINGTVGEVLRNVETGQSYLNTNMTQVVKTESRTFLNCQLQYFIVYADWAKLTITQQVGRCKPLAGAVDSVEIILCSYMVESLNAFWFSLGWCMIFFIPSIIFAIKLAKYYRRMKHSDIYDNHIVMNHIPRAQMKFT